MRDAAVYARFYTGHVPSEAELCPRKFWQALEPFDPNAPTVGDPLAVYLNAGRWVVQCPDCNSAQLASQADPRYMCNECANIANGGAFRPLLWPNNRAAIEAVLDARAPDNQNWLPGETIAQLKAENAAHGVGVR